MVRDDYEFVPWLSIHVNVGTSFWWPDVLPVINKLGLVKGCRNRATKSVEAEFCSASSEQMLDRYASCINIR